MQTKVDFDKDFLTIYTGDPFADCGGLVIKCLLRSNKNSVLELIKEVANIYVHKWDSKINAYFLNSKITQPAFKPAKKLEETLKYFQSMLDGTAEYREGYCRITGQYTRLYPAGRDASIMTGSGGFLNFHHSFDEGLYLSKEALVRLFFVPYGSMLVGGKVAIIHSNSLEVTYEFAAGIVKKNEDMVSKGIAEGVYKSPFKIPANALFGFAEEVISEYEDEIEADTVLNLYYFTNFGASPEISLYTLPATAFRFYQSCLRNDTQKVWKSFVNSYYRSSKSAKAIYNRDSNMYENGKKIIPFEEFYLWRNLVFERLLQEKSILGFMKTWTKKHSFSLKIVFEYVINILNMEKQTYDKVISLAEYIIEDNDRIKKALVGLEKVKNASELRRIFLSLIRHHYRRSPDAEPLITLQEYVEVLFPDGAWWSEVRDLLLIAIYQKLHEGNIQAEVPEDDEAEEYEINQTENA